MRHRHSLPRTWLVTDERQGDRLLPGIARLSWRSGILFRHYSLSADERRRLFDRVAKAAQESGHLLLLAGPFDLARTWGADGWHGPGRGPGLHSAAVHDRVQIRQAEAWGAGLLFLSPIRPTRSHPDTPVLGYGRFARLANGANRPVIALGGVGPRHARRLRMLGAYGWAGIDAWTG